jgi:hypothetical protein
MKDVEVKSKKERHLLEGRRGVIEIKLNYLLIIYQEDQMVF